MRLSTLRSLLLAAPAVLSLGCTSAPPQSTGTPVATDVPRNTSPQVASADEAALVAGNTDFAFDLYQGLTAGARRPTSSTRRTASRSRSP